MNEPAGPHGFYDGPVKELAARHLGLMRAIFFLLLVSLPGVLFFGLARNSGSLYVNRKYPDGDAYSSVKPGGVKLESIGLWAYDSSRDEIVSIRFLGFKVGPWYLRSHEDISTSCEYLAFAFGFLGAALLLFRFYRLTKLLYPQLAFYFTLVVLVPFVNLVVILLLLRSALRQMRQRGLRVGVFGIDPARFG